MRQQTDLMRHILKNEMAQRIIDFVSPIYGESYVGLWIYEAIGTVLLDVYTLAEQMRNETSPMTADLTLEYWEEQYGLHADSTLTIEQRRARLLEKIRFRAPCNPKRLAASISAIVGVPVDIAENVSKNTFRVDLNDSVNDFRKLAHAITVLNQRKPAHLIYRVATTANVDETKIKMASASALYESQKLETQAIRLSLQATVEKAIKMGAAINNEESHRLKTRDVSVNAEATIEKAVKISTGLSNEETHRLKTKDVNFNAESNVEEKITIASGLSNYEQQSIDKIKQEARIAVEAAFGLAHGMSAAEEHKP